MPILLKVTCTRESGFDAARCAGWSWTSATSARSSTTRPGSSADRRSPCPGPTTALTPRAWPWGLYSKPL